MSARDIARWKEARLVIPSSRSAERLGSVLGRIDLACRRVMSAAGRAERPSSNARMNVRQ
jgi:hypothetical protein